MHLGSEGRYGKNGEMHPGADNLSDGRKPFGDPLRNVRGASEGGDVPETPSALDLGTMGDRPCDIL